MQLSAITLNNADVTPVAITFEPISNVNKVVLFQEDDVAKAVGLRATASTNTRVGTASVARKVSHKLRNPYEITNADGSKTIKYSEVRIVEVFDIDAPTDNIADLRSFASDYMANAIVTDTAVNGRHPW